MPARRLGVAAAVALVLLAAPAPLRAQQAPGAPLLPVPLVMVVDSQAAMQQSKAGQGVRLQHDRYRQSFQDVLEAKRKALAETETELMKQKPVLNQETWQRQARDFEKQVVEFNQRYQKANLSVEKSYRAAMADLSRAFAQITAEVAGETGANLVLPIQQVILHDPRMDMTKVVIQRMDEKFPSVPFPPPEIETDATPQKGGRSP
jgi:Skp family chaperone for outer membrane proteins